jgi:cytoskeletal protein CcmA (bactofilin family)
MDENTNPIQGTPQDSEGAALNNVNDTGVPPVNPAEPDITELTRDAASLRSGVTSPVTPLPASAYEIQSQGEFVDTTAGHVPAASLFDFDPVSGQSAPVPPASAPAPIAAAPKPASTSPVVGFDLNAAPDPNTRVEPPAEAAKIDAEAAFEKAIAADDGIKTTPVEAIPVLDPGSTAEFPPVGLVDTDIEAEATAAVEEINAVHLAVAAAEISAVEEPVASYDTGETVADEEPVEKGISVITREATVLGDIITEGHIDVIGRVKGNIDAKGDIAIHGIVRGDVGGEKIGLYNCRVKGNLDSWLGVIVDEGSIIGGDVKTKNIILDGKVKGNIDAENVVVLRSHSYCLGDVSAASLAVEPGAILNGKVKTFVKGDLEAPFDEVM